MKKTACFALSLTLLFVMDAQGTVLNASTSVDNGYEIFISTDDGLAGTSFGFGADWPTTFDDSTVLAAGTDYFLHVRAYDVGGIGGFLGEFSLLGGGHTFVSGGTSLLTSANGDWQANNTGWGDPYLPVLTDLGGHGAGPWGMRPGIDGLARWIWTGDGDADDLVFFSTQISATAVPAPGSVLLFSLGLLILGARQLLARS